MREKIIRSLANIKPEHKGGVLTMGNFDGVHLGHQQLVKKTVSKARALNVPAIVITFEPQSFEFFAKGEVTIPRLTRFREKSCELFRYGSDYVLILPFNQQLAKLSASEFVSKILVDSLAPKRIIVGDDFHFG